ncbi:NAD(P)H nitroreductase [Pseudonocardia sp. NPDC049154]|uniref:Acg family FMN-binding oxidoreductase n=1 Tax=Pseudonocardia sp. NPDC049154 TaxID=3155501 RepID=UPI00340D3624
MSTDVAAGLLERAVQLALRAPSVHNTQPWRWRLRAREVELHADPARHLSGTDPDRRDLVISCGAALHHLRVAAAGFGGAVEIDRLPDPDHTWHLATVRLVEGQPDRAAAALFGQLTRRHTDRRRYSPEPVPEPHVAALVERAGDLGVVAVPVTDPAVLTRMTDVLGRAAREQRHEPGYLAELLMWTRRYADAGDGVPPTAVPVRTGQWDEPQLQRFPSGTLSPGRGLGPDGGLLMVLATPEDDTAARLAAGEATSAVLLTATRGGLATDPLSQAVEMPAARAGLRAALRLAEHPQLVIRLGFPAPGAPPLEPTPRRPLRSVLMHP